MIWRSRRALLPVALVILLSAICALLGPFLYAEYEFDLHGSKPVVQPKPARPSVGRWIDDYFLVEQIDADTFAIGEPRYYQGNYSYLILGSRRAILFDAGTGLKDIVPVVRSITTLPVTVIASHLHFDHVGALGHLDKTAVFDSPSLRQRASNSELTLDRYEFLGFADRLERPSFRVDEWWAPDSTIDLGQRYLRVLATPGHTPTSVSLYDEAHHLLFAGDFIYPGCLYAFLPGASRRSYLETTRRLLALIAPATRVLAAHMADGPESVHAPVLGSADLQALSEALEGIKSGRATSSGFYPRVFPVKGSIVFCTGWPWNNR